MRSKIPQANRSPHGWWLAVLVERYEHFDEDVTNPNRRCTCWRNTILIKARDRNEAYRKAVAQGKLGQDTVCGPAHGRQGHWVFEGLCSLLPVYDQLEDGAEILWEQAENITVKTVKACVRAKKALECFQDQETGSTPRRRA